MAPRLSTVLKKNRGALQETVKIENRINWIFWKATFEFIIEWFLKRFTFFFEKNLE